MNSKKGIALLITLMFVIAITASVGLGLKQINQATTEVDSEKFMLQSSIILDDVLKLLKTSKDIELIKKDNTGEAFYVFLSQASFIPFESHGMKISLELKSARAKININRLNKNSAMPDLMKAFLVDNMVNEEYVNLLIDSMSGIKEDMLYNSDIFLDNTDFFRDYISSSEQLYKINEFYKKKYHDNNLANIDFENLFYYSKDKETKIDLNYATSEVWMFLLGVQKDRADELAAGIGAYYKLEDIPLYDDEKLRLAKFNTSTYEPFIDVAVELSRDKQHSRIHFEYDLKNNKGSNFVYEI